MLSGNVNWEDDVHGRGDEIFIANEPDGYPCKIETLAGLSALRKTPHPGGVCMYRF